MSYSVYTPCGSCKKRLEGCVDGIVVTGAVQGIIHAIPFGTGHKGCGTVTLACTNSEKEEAPANG